MIKPSNSPRVSVLMICALARNSFASDQQTDERKHMSLIVASCAHVKLKLRLSKINKLQ
jgi:hypothetical protein